MGICCESELHIIHGVIAIVVILLVEVLIWTIIEHWDNCRKQEDIFMKEWTIKDTFSVIVMVVAIAAILCIVALQEDIL